MTAQFAGEIEAATSLVAVAEYVPALALNNDHFAQRTGRPAEWFERRTGIIERRRAGTDEDTASMGIRAVASLLEQIREWPEPVDLVISASYTPSDTIGTVAHRVQRHFNLSGARAFELSSACSSFLNALEVADSFFCAGRSRCALVVASEQNGRYSDEDTNHLWGDGAAAVLLGAAGKFRLLAIRTYGRAEVGRGPDAVRMSPMQGGLQMPHGREVFQHACDEMQEIGEQLVRDCGLSMRDVSLLVPHQANLRILSVLADRFSLPRERLAVTIDTLGNTGSASIPISFNRWAAHVPEGGYVLMLSFGGGYSVGAALLQRT